MRGGMDPHVAVRSGAGGGVRWQLWGTPLLQLLLMGGTRWGKESDCLHGLGGKGRPLPIYNFMNLHDRPAGLDAIWALRVARDARACVRARNQKSVRVTKGYRCIIIHHCILVIVFRGILEIGPNAPVSELFHI